MSFNKISTTLGLTLMLLGTAAAPVSAQPRDVSGSTSAELRLDYLGKLLESRSGQRLEKYDHGTTRTKVHALLDQARDAIAAGDEQNADRLTKQALHTIMTAMRGLPEDPEEIARNKARYENLRQGLEKFSLAEASNQERFVGENNAAGKYNQAQVNELLAQADSDAKAGNYEKAVVRLTKAQSIVTSSLQGMLNNKQLEIELDLSTPEKEYAYELRRYQGYEELIPVAIEKKRPSEMAKETMLKLGKKAKWMSEQARGKASQGDYPVAIRMIMDATDVAREALRVAGVTM